MAADVHLDWQPAAVGRRQRDQLPVELATVPGVGADGAAIAVVDDLHTPQHHDDPLLVSQAALASAAGRKPSAVSLITSHTSMARMSSEKRRASSLASSNRSPTRRSRRRASLRMTAAAWPGLALRSARASA